MLESPSSASGERTPEECTDQDSLDPSVLLPIQHELHRALETLVSQIEKDAKAGMASSHLKKLLEVKKSLVSIQERLGEISKSSPGGAISAKAKG